MEPLRGTPAPRVKGKFKANEGSINPAIRYGLTAEDVHLLKKTKTASSQH